MQTDSHIVKFHIHPIISQHCEAADSSKTCVNAKNITQSNTELIKFADSFSLFHAADSPINNYVTKSHAKTQHTLLPYRC